MRITGLPIGFIKDDDFMTACGQGDLFLRKCLYLVSYDVNTSEGASVLGKEMREIHFRTFRLKHLVRALPPCTRLRVIDVRDSECL